MSASLGVSAIDRAAGSQAQGATATPRDSADSGTRFAFVDGMRGVAAMMVVVFHLFENLRPATTLWFPTIASSAFSNGNLGVDLFFVLSGFVIAHSVRNGERSWRYLGRFALRRSTRLDPLMWFTILVEVALMRIGLMFFPSLGTTLPHWPQILANLTFTQQLLGVGDVVPVFWSLTYEVQFYLVLVTSLILLHRLAVHRHATTALFVAVFAYSLLIWLEVLPSPLRGLFIDRWFQFALGIAAWATFMKHIRLSTFVAFCVATLLTVLALNPVPYRAYAAESALLAATALVAVGLSGRMGSMWNGRVLQFLGGISYSLYLIHSSVGWRFISLVRKKFGPELSPVEGTSALVAAIAISIGLAWLMHAALERPTIRLSRMIRLPNAART